MSSFRLLGKDIVTYGIMGGISRSASLLLLPILTRLFSLAEYGVIDIVATMTSFLALLMALTLESAIARLWFESGRDNKQKQLVSSIIVFILTFGVVVFAVIWYESAWIAKLLLGDSLFGTYVALGALFALLSALSGIPQIILRMERRIVHYNVLIVVQTVSYVIIALSLAVHFRMGLQGIFLGQVFASGLTLATGLFWVSKYLRYDFSLLHLKSSLHFSLPMFPAVVVTWANNQVDRMILLAFLGVSVVGIFGAAARIAMLIGLLVTIFQQAWTPIAIENIDNESGRNEFYRRALNYYAGAMAAIALVLVAFSKEVLALLVPTEYLAGYVVIPWLIGAQILHGSGGITNLGMLISKRTFGNSIAAWTGVAVNLGLGLLLIPQVGIWGAALGSFFAELVFTSLLWRFSVQVTDIQFDRQRLLGVLGCYVVTCGLVIVTYEFVANPVQSLITRSLLLGIALCVIIYLTMDAFLLRGFTTVQKIFR